MAFPILFTRDQ
ncbi:hypothetical protein BC938DRAFT_474921 [Jimgerdemannia flammicorona]|uniref:Uncharacterized protein n=1 Tax=Jimgerdemannia flammicorona TaxID=994334 RepID=A0A433QS73_9FUNG|nr:hypothetical protein BC938DRAFT_474921 [Jimgerdemannia flammicorona]